MGSSSTKEEKPAAAAGAKPSGSVSSTSSSKPTASTNSASARRVPPSPSSSKGLEPARTRSSKLGGHDRFIVDNPGKVEEFYDIAKVMGEGSYGTVSRCQSKRAPKNPRACKSISKAHVKNPERFKQEIVIMKMMDHPYIIKLFETFEDHKNIYLIMELCEGGELFDRIIEAGHFTEKQAAILMQQTLSGIYYMHMSSICHRDIKPENFLFSTKEPIEKSTLKIIDFGLSCHFSPGQVLSTKAGTPYYVAPQVLEGKYDQACDLWSCGVIMYVLLCGYPPFYAESDQEVLKKVRIANLEFDPAEWASVSDDAKNLIRNLLKKSVKDRYTAEQALNHVWVKDHAPKATGSPLSRGLVDNLRGFRSQNKLKKAALHVIASQLKEDQIKALRSVFMQLDANGDGLLTAEELKQGLEAAHIKEIPVDLQEILKEVDSDGSGMIDYTEFLAATLDKKMYLEEDICWSAFRVFDRNGDGKISKEELKIVLGDGELGDKLGTSQEALEELLKEVDANGDGEIDFQEFMTMMRKI